MFFGIERELNLKSRREEDLRLRCNPLVLCNKKEKKLAATPVAQVRSKNGNKTFSW